MFSVYPSICLASSGYNSLYSFLFSGYGIQKLSFQGVRVVSHRRGFLEIPLKAKLPIFFKLSSVFLIFFAKKIQTALSAVWIIAYLNEITDKPEVLILSLAADYGALLGKWRQCYRNRLPPQKHTSFFRQQSFKGMVQQPSPSSV